MSSSVVLLSNDEKRYLYELEDSAADARTGLLAGAFSISILSVSALFKSKGNLGKVVGVSGIAVTAGAVILAADFHSLSSLAQRLKNLEASKRSPFEKIFLTEFLQNRNAIPSTYLSNTYVMRIYPDFAEKLLK